MTVDRRRSPRIELLGRVHGQMVAYDVEVIVRNMSLGGLLLESTMAFPVGVTQDFRLMMGDESAVLLRGTVVRSVPEQNEDGDTIYVTGVRFVEDAPGEAQPGVEDLMGRLE
jgi:hypothetical protein